MARASLSQSSLPLSTPNENEEERKGRGKVIPFFRVSLPAATWLPPIRHGWDGLGWDVGEITEMGCGWEGVGWGMGIGWVGWDVGGNNGCGVGCGSWGVMGD